MNSSLRHRRAIAIVALLALAGCSTLAVRNIDALFGAASPKEYVPVASAPVEYHRDVKPILEQRCLVCHGCYDAPCQLKLDSFEGLLRGGSKQQVYQSTRFAPGSLSRLFEDAHSTAVWREFGFHPVLNERVNSPAANLQASVMARMLELKQRHPLPAGKTLPKEFDFSLEREEQCPTIEEFDSFEKKFSLWGMPYGLPAIAKTEHDTLRNWLANGAPAGVIAPLSPSLEKEVEYWEALFNGDTLKHQLAARYVYEHLFLAHLYLEDVGANTVYFKVVRSRTPPGQPISMISTRRPYDDPGEGRVYYRLWRDPAGIVTKTHMPYRLTSERRDRWKQWFIDEPYSVTQLPTYDPAVASNPFLTYEAIPYNSRHSFLLDEAEFTVMNFIKGPVCRGNVALNVIQDRFWVFFTPPQTKVSKQFAEFLAKQDGHLRLPAGAESGLWSIAHWRTYAKAQQEYLKAKGDFIRANAAALESAQLGTFWDGDGKNPNLALTVFRHYDSATVAKGLIGEQPQTAWLIDYPILERIHYLLVAGFDVYGTTSHQAMTRLYMDFLRMESEMNFLAFLPETQRRAEVANWYRDADDSVREYLDAYFEQGVLPTPYRYTTDGHKQELFSALHRHVAKALNHSYDLSKSGLSADNIRELDKLNRVRGVAASLIPQSAIIRISDGGLLTLLSNSAYSNISSMFGEQDRRLVAEDNMTIAAGVLTAYPNVLFELDSAEIPAFVKAVSELRTEDDYSRLLDRFGMRRTDADFWALSDRVHADFRKHEPLTAGVLDYNRYDNR